MARFFRLAAVVSTVSAAFVPAAFAASSLQAYGLSTGGTALLGAAGPPLSCSTFGPDPRVTGFFGTSIVQVGLASDGPVCGIAVDSALQTSSGGASAQAGSSLNVNWASGTDLRSYSGSSDGRAGYGNLGVRAHASYLGSVDGFTQEGSQAFALQTETMNFGGAVGSGTFRPTFTIDGALFADGRTYSQLSFHWSVGNGPVFMSFRILNNAGFVTLYGPNGFVDSFAGMTTTGSATTGFTVAGTTSFTVDMPITFGTDLDVRYGLWAGIIPSSSVGQPGPSAGDTDFYSSLRLTGIEVLDALGQPVNGFSITSGSGTQYGPGGVVAVVPEPATALLWLAGLLFVWRRGLRRHGAHAGNGA